MTLRIGITGSDGFLAYHLRAKLYSLGFKQIQLANRSIFEHDHLLDHFVKSSDIIFHLAGVNRHPSEDLEQANIEIAKKLIVASERSHSQSTIAYASSTHIMKDSAYGRGKKIAGEIIAEYCQKNDLPFGNFIFPHIFGEFSRPFYNSAVATFSYQLAHDQPQKIENDSELNLIHAQDAVEILSAFANHPATVTQCPQGTKIKVSDLLRILQDMNAAYRKNVLPLLNDDFTRDLFNTFRSYLFPWFYPVSLALHRDARGFLYESVKGGGHGQSFISSTNPQVTRGNHFHLRKIERFVVVEGEAVILIRKLFTNEIHRFHVSGENPSFIDIPTFCTHNITNISDKPLMTLFWVHEIFDPEHPDTYAEVV